MIVVRALSICHKECPLAETCSMESDHCQYSISENSTRVSANISVYLKTQFWICENISKSFKIYKKKSVRKDKKNSSMTLQMFHPQIFRFLKWSQAEFQKKHFGIVLTGQ